MFENREMLNSIAEVKEIVRKAAALAARRQQRFDFTRRQLKADGTVLTEIDQEIDELLYRHLRQAYPDANILTEETTREFDPHRPYTFAVDPIDGTDVFSQGMPGWSISVGLLDSHWRPVAGVVYSPRWDALFFKDVEGSAYYNEQEISPPPVRPIDSNTSLLVYSHVHHDLDLQRYPGKIRNFGSTALHMCFPLIYPGVCGALLRRVHIWDLAGAHAILDAAGFSLEYLDGSAVEYSRLVDGSSTPDFLLAAPPEAMHSIRQFISRIS